jgi:hypothetical protein
MKKMMKKDTEMNETMKKTHVLLLQLEFQLVLCDLYPGMIFITNLVVTVSFPLH